MLTTSSLPLREFSNEQNPFCRCGRARRNQGHDPTNAIGHYELIADKLSPEDKSQIAQALWKNSIRPTLDGYFTYSRLPIPASNHEPQSVGGAIEACVVLYGGVPDSATRFGPALAQLLVAYASVELRAD